MKSLSVATMLLILACAAAAAEELAGNPAAGHELALHVCSVCHAAAADQPFAPRLEQRTPSFSDIANRPNMSASYLHRFITTTHWDEHTLPMTMPDPMLNEDQIADVTSYILSLRKRP